MAYASRSTASLDVMRAHGWRQLIEPSHLGKMALRTRKPELRYMLDNGAWGCHLRAVPWNPALFIELLDLHGRGSDMTVLPDIVGGGEESLELSLSWVKRVRAYGAPLLLAVQDGMPLSSVEVALRRYRLGIFVGGSTEWKLETLPDWGRMARKVGCWLHVARVNSMKRIRLCHLAGAHSFDGTSVTKFPSTIARLDAARRQPTLFGGFND